MTEPGPNRSMPTATDKWPPPAHPGREQDRATLNHAQGPGAAPLVLPVSNGSHLWAALDCSCAPLHRISVDLPPESVFCASCERECQWYTVLNQLPNAGRSTKGTFRVLLVSCFLHYVIPSAGSSASDRDIVAPVPVELGIFEDRVRCCA
jgi:hypothetical protein